MAALKNTKDFYDGIVIIWNDRFDPELSLPHQTFTNLIWQIVVNELDSDKIFCLYPIHGQEGEYVLVKVFQNTGGYVITGVAFAEDVDEYEDALKLCIELNQQLFGIDKDTVIRIVDSSMEKQKQSS